MITRSDCSELCLPGYNELTMLAAWSLAFCSTQQAMRSPRYYESIKPECDGRKTTYRRGNPTEEKQQCEHISHPVLRARPRRRHDSSPGLASATPLSGGDMRSHVVRLPGKHSTPLKALSRRSRTMMSRRKQSVNVVSY